MPKKYVEQDPRNEGTIPDLDNLFSDPEQFDLDSTSNLITRTVNIGKYRGVTSLPSNLVKQVRPSSNIAERFDKSWLQSPTSPEHETTGPYIRVVDLFAGCGGLSVGVREAVSALGGRFASIFASDIDEGAISIYSTNFSPKYISSQPIQDIFQSEFSAILSGKEQEIQGQCGQIDFLIGGPPCQGHSDLNNHTRRDDPRNELYSIMGRAASVLKPRYVIIENVLGVRHSSTGVAQKTLEHLNSLGYQTESITLNAVDFGVAQNRKRHFTLAMAGNPKRLHRTLELLHRPLRPVMWAIDDLIDETGSNTEAFYSSANHSATNKKRIDYLFDNNLYELPDLQRPDCHRLKPHSYNSVYGRMRPESQAPTITSGFGSTGQGRFVHPHRRRTLTPHEAARVQFFPDWFNFREFGRRQLQKYIGNAVPPKLGYALALSLLSTDEGDL